MLYLAKSIKFNIVQRHINNEKYLLALFLGQANLFTKYKLDDIEELKKIYIFLKEKYKLCTFNIKWHFFRLYPKNFPQNRIIQFVNILYKNNSLLNLVTNEDYLYFTKRLECVRPKFSSLLIENLIINLFIPLNAFYSKYNCVGDYEKFFYLLKNIKPEDNNIVRKFDNIIAKNAFETQALIELFNIYCSKFMCLKCPVILKKK
jgi:hypothetical protein